MTMNTTRCIFLKLIFPLLCISFSPAFAQVSGGSFTATTCADGNVTWTNPGTINTILIFAKAGSAITVGTPTSNESAYTASATFGSGTVYQNDPAAFCIYKSTTSGTSVSITNLTPGTTYHFLAYNVNGTTYSAPHTFSGGPTPTLTNASSVQTISDNNQVTLSWINPTCFDEVMVVAKPSTTIAGVPTGDGSAFIADADFGGSGTIFDVTGKVVYKNNGTSVTVTGLTNGATYFFRIFTRKGTTWSNGVEVSAIPYEPVSGGSFSQACLNTGTPIWTNPATVGTIVVFAKAGSAITVGTPTSNISTYTNNAAFGSGTPYQHDANAYCIYKGTATSVNITALSAGTTYHFLVFNANGTSYSPAHTFSGNTLTTPPNVTGLAGSPSANSVSLSWTNPACFDEVLMVAKTSTISGTPTGDGSAYTADSDFGGSGTTFDTSGKVVYKGSGSSVNVTGLSASSTYFFKVFTRKGTTWSAGVEISTTTICTPTNATALSISDTNTTGTISWTNPACLDEVMIVVKQGSTVTGTPTGDGSAYTASLDFTSGSSSVFDGGKVVYKGSTSTQTVTNLTAGNVYFFTIFTRKGTLWSSGTSISTATGPPLVTAFDPPDNSTGIPTDQSFTITFNEDVFISSAAFTGSNNVIEFDKSGTGDLVINRDGSGPDGTISIVGNVATITLSTPLDVSTAYNILIGDRVFRDGSTNHYAGTSAGNWNFTTTSGVTLTAPVVGTCLGQFSTLGDIVITEVNNNNLQGTNSGTLTVVLGFDKTGYVFNPSIAGVTATFSPGGDIQAITVTSITFTQATFSIQFDASARNELDVITISGLKVSRDGSMAPPAIVVVKPTSTLSIQGISPDITPLATINGGTIPSAPTVVYPGGDNSYCVNDNFSSISISATDPDPAPETFNWYNDASLTSVNAINANSRTVAQLIGASPLPGTYTRYVTQVDGCESVASTVTIIITSLPVANAGPDLTGANAVCSGSSVTLGGSPTASGGSGSYSYSWTGPGSPASVANPVHTMPDPGVTDQTYNYQVIVTDGNNCSSSPSIKQITVKNLSQIVTIDQPTTYFFTVNNNPVELVGNPPGGVFSGVGVTQLSGTYQFDPELAGINTSPGWPVTYTTTLSNGCTKSVVQNFEVANAYDVFPNLEVQYCNNEGSVLLEISPAIITDIQNFINTWNTVYVPTYGYSPLKTTISGIIRNEYATYYGQNNGVQKVPGTYTVGGWTLDNYRFYPSQFLTDQAYPPGGGIYGTCPNCTYAFISVFVEFASPLATSPYNMPVGTDLGWRFNNGTVAAFSFNGEFVNINPVPIVNFAGLNTSYCNINTNFTLTGNKPGGSFEISNDPYNENPSTFGDVVGDGIKDVTEGIAPGLGEFNPQEAFGGAASAIVKWIRYSVDPGTVGSDGVTGCIGKQIRGTTIYPSDPVVFRSSVPPNDTEFCYEGASINITMGFTAGGPAITSGISYSGFGISDSGNGVGVFTPKTAFDQQAPGATTPQTIVITASYTNAQGCVYSINRNFIVRPKPALTVTVTDVSTNNPPPDNNFCYNDADLTILGNQPPSSTYKYEIEYLTLGYVQTINSHTFTFDPSFYFDDAVTRGASNTSDATFRVTYIVTDAVIGCTASTSFIFAVSPLAEITISGINDGDIFCSNVQPFPITFAPINGTLRVNGTPTPLNPLTSSISSVQLPVNNNVTISYEYFSGVSQCVTTKTYTISQVDAPKATFSTAPICDGDPATYTAGPDPDNHSWKWVLGDSVRSGTTVETINHVFPGLAGATQTSYLIRLIVTNGPSALKVCRDSTEAIQVIGAYPRIDFDYSNVCKDDYTKFSITSNIPIASAQWNFGDGYTLSNNPLNNTIPGGTHSGQTTGTYGAPEHRYSTANTRYLVQLIGRTATSVGACPDTILHQVGILEKLKPNTTYPYKMDSIPGGLWIEEDRSNTSTWAFATPTGKTVMTNTVGNVWITNPLANYRQSDNSYVNSPCFDLTAFTKPVFSLQYWANTDPGKDGALLQSSIDGGTTWQVVGTTTSGINWYENQTISSAPGGFNQYGWTGRMQQDWHIAKNSIDVLAGNNNVRFRIAFSSDERDEFDGFAFNDVTIEERNRIMLVEHFSNSDVDNPLIPASNNNYNSHLPLNDAEVVKIQYHASFPDADDINAANPSDHNARIAYYGVTNQTIPIGFIDGKRDVSAPFGFALPANPNNGWWNDFKLKRSLTSSPYLLSVKSLPVSGSDSLRVNVVFSKIGDVQGNKATLLVAIIEKSVSGNEHVLRKFLPTPAGTLIDQVTSDSLVFDWRPVGITNLNDIAIIAFIQDMTTKEVHQAAIDIAPTFIPNGIITAIEDPAFAEKVDVYPNPASHELNILLPEPARTATPFVLIDAHGRSLVEQEFAPGQQLKTLNTSQLAGGLYILQLKSQQGTVRKKVMIVHGR